MTMTLTTPTLRRERTGCTPPAAQVPRIGTATPPATSAAHPQAPGVEGASPHCHPNRAKGTARC